MNVVIRNEKCLTSRAMKNFYKIKKKVPIKFLNRVLYKPGQALRAPGG
jgi:hypothetical protein